MARPRLLRWSAAYRPGVAIVTEIASGTVLRHGTEDRYLLLHETDEDRWTLPKGHVEAGESLLAAATRETREETGVARFRIVREIGEVNYRFYHPSRGVNVHKTTIFFLATTAEETAHPESGFDRAEWFSGRRALDAVPYESDRSILRAAIAVRKRSGKG
jgi:8-oxo-dGTP pyrophosphatase MutT (NUDIX family)